MNRPDGRVRLMNLNFHESPSATMRSSGLQTFASRVHSSDLVKAGGSLAGEKGLTARASGTVAVSVAVLVDVSVDVGGAVAGAVAKAVAEVVAEDVAEAVAEAVARAAAADDPRALEHLPPCSPPAPTPTLPDLPHHHLCLPAAVPGTHSLRAHGRAARVRPSSAAAHPHRNGSSQCSSEWGGQRRWFWCTRCGEPHRIEAAETHSIETADPQQHIIWEGALPLQLAMLLLQQSI
ncbi:unnamed protein product [Closterium sp. NIES-65]|nr:unnamed protein product [Closterium sp. NIES-65]